MDTAPSVSVLLPVYNGEPFLQAALESILEQTFDDFELVIVDDGSTDGSIETIEAFSDSRIRLLQPSSRLGLTGSLNRGLDNCHGEFIARMDADDVARPTRLEKQVEVLRSHPGVGIVSSRCRLIDEDGRERGIYPVPETDSEIRWRSLFASPFAHPSATLRASVLEDHGLSYREGPEFLAVEDYDLWVRLLRHTEGRNVQECLTSLRRGHEGVSASHADTQRRNTARVARRAIANEIPEFDISLEEIAEILDYIFAWRSTSVSHREVIQRYLRVLDAFEAGHPDLDHGHRVRERATVDVSRALIRPPISLPGPKLIARLLRLNPSVPVDLCLYLLAVHSHRVRELVRYSRILWNEG